MIITTKEPETWQDLQNKVAEILSQCGFNVEVEKTIETARGEVEVDVYAEELMKGRKYTIICECKYWKSNIPKNVVHGFRTVVGDVGCNIGYIITTSGFQSGSVSTAVFTNVELLDFKTFQLKFFEGWFTSYFSPYLQERLDPLMTYCEPILPRWLHRATEEDHDLYYALKQKYDLFGFMLMTFMPYVRMFTDNPIPTLPLALSIKEENDVISKIPSEILNETGYKEFGDKCCAYGEAAILEFRSIRDRYWNESVDSE